MALPTGAPAKTFHNSFLIPHSSLITPHYSLLPFSVFIIYNKKCPSDVNDNVSEGYFGFCFSEP